MTKGDKVCVILRDRTEVVGTVEQIADEWMKYRIILKIPPSHQRRRS